MWADPPISVALVEDDAATRERLTHVLAAAPGIALVHTAASAGQMLDWLAGNSVNVLLVDLGLPDRSGLEVIRWCSTHQPATNVMVVTLFGDEAHMIGAFEAGARGYLLKGAEPEEIERALRTVAGGSAVLAPRIAEHVLGRVTRRPAGESLPELTAREHDVLTLIAQGASNTAIAQGLGIAAKTVGNHVSSIFLKLGVATRAEAIVRAREAGYGR